MPACRRSSRTVWKPILDSVRLADAHHDPAPPTPRSPTRPHPAAGAGAGARRGAVCDGIRLPGRGAEWRELRRCGCNVRPVRPVVADRVTVAAPSRQRPSPRRNCPAARSARIRSRPRPPRAKVRNVHLKWLPSVTAHSCHGDNPLGFAAEFPSIPPVPPTAPIAEARPADSISLSDDPQVRASPFPPTRRPDAANPLKSSAMIPASTRRQSHRPSGPRERVRAGPARQTPTGEPHDPAHCGPLSSRRSCSRRPRPLTTPGSRRTPTSSAPATPSTST